MGKMKLSIHVGEGLEAIKQKAKQDLGIDIAYVRLCDNKGNIVPISHIELVPAGAALTTSTVTYKVSTDEEALPSLELIGKEELDVAISPGTCSRALENVVKLYGKEGIDVPTVMKILKPKFGRDKVHASLYYTTATKQCIRRDWDVKPNMLYWYGD